MEIFSQNTKMSAEDKRKIQELRRKDIVPQHSFMCRPSQAMVEVAQISSKCGLNCNKSLQVEHTEQEVKQQFPNIESRIGCQFVLISENYSVPCGNHYDFTSIEIEEFTPKFGIILYDYRCHRQYRYVYDNGIISNTKAEKYGTGIYCTFSYESIDCEHLDYIDKIVSQMKTGGYQLTKKR